MKLHEEMQNGCFQLLNLYKPVKIGRNSVLSQYIGSLSKEGKVDSDSILYPLLIRETT